VHGGATPDVFTDAGTAVSRGWYVEVPWTSRPSGTLEVRAPSRASCRGPPRQSALLFDRSHHPDCRAGSWGVLNACAHNSRNTGSHMRDQSCLDDLSVRAAMAGWRAGEAFLSAELGSTPVLTPGLIERWLVFYGLTDRLRRAQHQQFVGFLEHTARPVLRGVGAVSPETFGLVDDLNSRAVRERITSASLTMLLSRFACACAPAVFAPSTQHSRRGIQILGHKLADMSYRSFMLAVMKERERFADRVATWLLVHEGAGTGSPPITLDVLVMRALDHRLMLAGGYLPDQLEATILAWETAVDAPERAIGYRRSAGRPLQANRAAG
jgi:hypothetical protein